MKNKKKQRERLGRTTFEQPADYFKSSTNGAQSANGNGVVKTAEKSKSKRVANDEEKSSRKKIKKNDSPKSQTKPSVAESHLKGVSEKTRISHLFSDHYRLLPGMDREAMAKSYSNSTP